MNSWFLIWFIALIFKLVLGFLLPLTPDEAYYWVWSKHISFSYYDHPGGIAWLMYLGDLLPEKLVRWPALFLAHSSLLFWRSFLSSHLTEDQLKLWLVLMLTMPLTGLGSLIVTPDLPLLFSWSFCIWSFGRMLKMGATPFSVLLSGFALGLGLLSKYHIVLLIPIGLYFWWTDVKRVPLVKWLPLVIFSSAITSLPLWIWNYQHDWASFKFQMAHGLGRPEWKPSWTSDYIASQIGLIFPTLFWISLKSRWAMRYQLMAWFPLLFFFGTSFKAFVEANWPIVSYAMIYALAASQWPKYKKTFVLSISFVATLGLIVVLEATQFIQIEAFRNTKLAELHKFDKVAENTKYLTPLYARSYQMASSVSFIQKRIVYKLKGINRRDFFDHLEESLPTTDVFYLAAEKQDLLPEQYSEYKRIRTIAVDDRHEIWELRKR